MTYAERTLVVLILAGTVLYSFGPYFSDHLMIAGLFLLIVGVLILCAAITQKLRRHP